MKAFNIGDLKIKVPIIQGGMGIGISLSGLASSVANMGGIGIISTVGIGIVNKNINSSSRKSNIEAIRQEIRKARELSLGVIGVNIMTALTNFSDMVRTSVEGPKAGGHLGFKPDALLQAARGNLADGFAFTGANAGKVDKISTVSNVFTELIKEYRQAQNDD
ncbi:MAG: nitronate monooxygenase [Bacteroidota bacterium]|nr:nitronate monooxygenase [Bacteroidota bacterium]